MKRTPIQRLLVLRDFQSQLNRVLGDPRSHRITNPLRFASFEQGCAHDSTGRSDLAVPLYREALETGLTGIRRRRASIQLASSLRNIGALDECLSILESELSQDSDELDAAVRGFLSLALNDKGRKDEALFHSLQALSSYLPRYNRLMYRYAAMLVEDNE